MKTLRLLMAAAIAATISGCGDDSAPASTNAGSAGDTAANVVSESAGNAESGLNQSSSSNPLLDRVDAQTAYLFANVKRLPESVSNRMWEINEINASQQTALLKGVVEDEEMPVEAKAIVERLSDLGTREGWLAAGLHPNPFVAVHSVDLMPVAHLELADADAFASFIDGIEADLEQPLTRRDIDGREVIWIELRPGFGVAASHDESSVTIALTPDEADNLARIAGQTGPAEAFGESGLNAFNREQGFSANGSGFVDIRRLMASLLDPESTLMDLADESEKARFMSVIDNPSCVAEYTAIAEAMPQTVFGYTRIDNERLDMAVRQDLSEKIAAAVKPIASAPVALDRELNGLFNFGVAMDLVKAREFARGLVDGWVAAPPQCPSFAKIASEAADWQKALAQPIPPVVTNLHGLFLEAETLEIDEQGMPTGGGTLAFYMNQPQLLVGMAQMFVPAAAAMDLKPGGEALPVPSDIAPQLANTNLDLWIAMADSALGVAVGEPQVSSLKNSLEQTEGDDSVIAGRMDMSLLPQLVDIAEKALSDIESPEAQAGLAMQRAQYEAIARVYDRADFQIKLTDRGIEILSQTTLKD